MFVKLEKQVVNKILAAQKLTNNKDTRSFCKKTHHDAAEGQKIIELLNCKTGHYLLMDSTYEDNETQDLTLRRGFVFIDLPKKKNILAI